MFTSLTQARALYEFFYGGRTAADDARACDFCSSWSPKQTNLYRDYMAGQKPANKRVFHLVYDRATHAGGPGHDGPDHLKNRVLHFAKDLRQLTEDFIDCVEPQFSDAARAALDDAITEAKTIAHRYGVANPL